jgi:hypothetical protein
MKNKGEQLWQKSKLIVTNAKWKRIWFGFESRSVRTLKKLLKLIIKIIINLLLIDHFLPTSILNTGSGT